MSYSDWQELHNDNGGDESDKVIVEKEIEVMNNVVYEYKAEVELFRGIPCSAEVISMTRIVYDENGDFEEPYELCVSEFPEYITRAAEKKAVEEI